MSPLLDSTPIPSWLGLFLLAGTPTILLGCTSFLKLSVVIGILKNAIGVQGVPSSMVTGLLAFALTCHIMTPTARETVAAVLGEISRQSGVESIKELQVQKGAKSALPKAGKGSFSKNTDPKLQVEQLIALWDVGSAPLRRFMERHAGERERQFFALPEKALPVKALPVKALPVKSLSVKSLSGLSLPAISQPSPVQPARSSQGEANVSEQMNEESFLSLFPAFLITELTRGFALGVSIFLPFLVVDLLVTNILLALGMSMVSPLTFALPLKLALFVLCDGWFHLSRSLVLSY